MGVWIEIRQAIIIREYLHRFTPVWGCGLKSYRLLPTLRTRVHPRVGVWIEIKIKETGLIGQAVHPRVGVWIEIVNMHNSTPEIL